MNFVYILEGQLKYESIEYDSLLIFELYNKNGKVRDNNKESSRLVYFLPSEIDLSISLDDSTKKIQFSTQEDIQVFITGKDGVEKETKTKDYIDINDDLIKVNIPKIGFSFLLNTKEEPAKIESSKDAFDLKGILNQNRNKIKVVIPLFLIAIAFLTFLNKDKIPTNKVVFFNDQSELMRANLSTLDSVDVLVKSDLKQKIVKLLDEIGIKYIRFDLVQINEKVNLILYVFEKKNDDLEKAVGLAEVFWLNDVIFQALNPKSMYEDFNSIAEKYNLKKQDIFNQNLNHQLVAVNMTNNNLRYNSIQRDTKVFFERWGKNYIEFNVNLVQKKEMTFDFMITNGKERIIKSGQGYYFN